jgi:peptidoglycan/xylan/chitin deacetylase (PgdA/CDA1 family)
VHDPATPITRAVQLPRGTAKSRIKHALTSAAAVCHGRLAWAEASLRTPRVQVLCMHDGFADEHAALLRLCGFLTAQHTVVNYSAAVDAMTSGTIAAPLVALSFDDGFKHHVQVAQQLRALGISAMFFLCTEALSLTGGDAHRRFCNQRLRRPWIELMNWGDAEAVLGLGHEVGCHTHGHFDLAKIAPAHASEQIARAAAEMNRRLGPVRHFAWPFGRFENFTPPCLGAVAACGFASCASSEAGCHRGEAPLSRVPCVRRVSVEPRWALRDVRYLLARAVSGWSHSDGGWPDPFLQTYPVLQRNGT